jgi:hypothetical protein
LLFQGVALAAHAASYDVIIQTFAVAFKLSQQTPFVMGYMHNRVMMSFQ